MQKVAFFDICVLPAAVVWCKVQLVDCWYVVKLSGFL